MQPLIRDFDFMKMFEPYYHSAEQHTVRTMKDIFLLCAEFVDQVLRMLIR
jgi:hypothetical protein